jgi:hypothetical protein
MFNQIALYIASLLQICFTNYVTASLIICANIMPRRSRHRLRVPASLLQHVDHTGRFQMPAAIVQSMNRTERNQTPAGVAAFDQEVEQMLAENGGSDIITSRPPEPHPGAAALAESLECVQPDWRLRRGTQLTTYVPTGQAPSDYSGADRAVIERPMTEFGVSQDMVERLLAVLWLSKQMTALGMHPDFIKEREHHHSVLLGHTTVRRLWYDVVAEHNGHVKTLEELYQHHS